MCCDGVHERYIMWDGCTDKSKANAPSVSTPADNMCSQHGVQWEGETLRYVEPTFEVAFGDVTSILIPAREVFFASRINWNAMHAQVR